MLEKERLPVGGEALARKQVSPRRIGFRFIDGVGMRGQEIDVGMRLDQSACLAGVKLPHVYQRERMAGVGSRGGLKLLHKRIAIPTGCRATHLGGEKHTPPPPPPAPPPF